MNLNFILEGIIISGSMLINNQCACDFIDNWNPRRLFRVILLIPPIGICTWVVSSIKTNLYH